MKKLFLLSLFCFTSQFGQAQGVSLQTISNYNSWKWSAIVMKNDFITIATVPIIGGRIMQYDLGNLPSVFVNSAEFGKTYTPAQNGQWHNFGGYKTWLSPQGRWPNTWPPPPILDYGNYTSSVDTTSKDSVSVEVTSLVEQWISTGLRFIRKATMYPGTSRVKLEQTMSNEGTTVASWGMWSITQSIVNHPSKTDYSNYWAYFPINPNSVFGKSGVNPELPSAAWKGEVVPGVYGVQFTASNKKIFADSHKGWIAYTSLSDSVLFAKTFPLFEGAHYPDSARVTVYVSSAPPAYMEIEIKAPIIDLAANGGKYTFTENWWASKVRAPIVDVNTIGAIAKRLSYNSGTQNISGVYGLFYQGTAKVVFVDSNDQVMTQGISHAVSPLEEFQLQEKLSIPKSAYAAEVRVTTAKVYPVGTLDSVSISGLTSVFSENNPVVISEFQLEQNYPNPFNPSTVISYQLPMNSNVSLKVYDALGREVATLVNEYQSTGRYSVEFDGSKLSSGMSSKGGYASGVYFYKLVSEKFTQVKRMMLLK